MLCKKPYLKGIVPYPCGQCLPCRLNRRRLWTHRLLLEQACHEESSFWTLTYDDEHLPPGGTVVPRHLQLWLKRLRKASGRHLRFFGVGEYGDESQRPHYHAAIFGVSRVEGPEFHCWPYGHVHVGDLTLQSAQYVAGYVTKKMTNVDDPRLAGRHPEFARMSLRPGIGALAMPDVAGALSDVHGARLLSEAGDVPLALRHGGRSLPLGRYLRRKLRDELGFETLGGQAKPMAQQKEEMQALYDATGSRPLYLQTKPMIEHVRIRQIETKARIWAKKGAL